MHPNCKKIFIDSCKKYFKPGMRVLEAGPSFNPPSWYETQVNSGKFDTVDVREDRSPTGKHHDVKFTGTPYSYPIPDSQYDIIFAAMVIEHVPMPWKWILELKRVCKDGGLIIILAPFVGNQHGRIDCFRFLPQGLEALSEYAGLTVVETGLFDSVKEDYHIDSLLVAKK
jgi:SAM-dependent methyltransferase